MIRESSSVTRLIDPGLGTFLLGAVWVRDPSVCFPFFESSEVAATTPPSLHIRRARPPARRPPARPASASLDRSLSTALPAPRQLSGMSIPSEFSSASASSATASTVALLLRQQPRFQILDVPPAQRTVLGGIGFAPGRATQTRLGPTSGIPSAWARSQDLGKCSGFSSSKNIAAFGRMGYGVVVSAACWRRGASETPPNRRWLARNGPRSKTPPSHTRKTTTPASPPDAILPIPVSCRESSNETQLQLAHHLHHEAKARWRLRQPFLHRRPRKLIRSLSKSTVLKSIF